MPKTVPTTQAAPDPDKNPGETGERGTSVLPGTGETWLIKNEDLRIGDTSGSTPLSTMNMLGDPVPESARVDREINYSTYPNKADNK